MAWRHERQGCSDHPHDPHPHDPESDATGKLRELYDADLKNNGHVANYTKAMSLRPETIAA